MCKQQQQQQQHSSSSSVRKRLPLIDGALAAVTFYVDHIVSKTSAHGVINSRRSSIEPLPLPCFCAVSSIILVVVELNLTFAALPAAHVACMPARLIGVACKFLHSFGD